MAVRDMYLIPRIQECTDNRRVMKAFRTLNVSSGYCQILIAANDRDKKTFTTHFERYVFTQRSLELKNTQKTFQREVDTILTTAKSQSTLEYLNDEIVFLSYSKE